MRLPRWLTRSGLKSVSWMSATRLFPTLTTSEPASSKRIVSYRFIAEIANRQHSGCK
jgi:hypothetical protein